MTITKRIVLDTVLICAFLHASLLEKLAKRTGDVLEYCQSEYFQPRCSNNEVILMKSAVYGRMHTGRCITAEAAAALGPIGGKDPRYFGCSEDVLFLLDRKCTGMRECGFRVIDISDENIKPCFPDLVVYLEASYSCIHVADEKRSCAVDASKIPVHISGFAYDQITCGTRAQPWVIQAPAGQKVRIKLLDFAVSHTNESHDQGKHICHNYGAVVDRVGKRNTTICGGGGEREKDLHLSSGNAVEIILAQSNSKEHRRNSTRFMLKLETVGCLDLIPPEDTWLKRNDDVIKIGCYSSRQVWHLSCNDGRWFGVLGNCSHGGDNSIAQSEDEQTISYEEQVLAMVAIGGCTLAVCLAIICIGAVCLRRFYIRSKRHQDYKTLSFHANSSGSQRFNHRNPSGHDVEILRNEEQRLDIPAVPSYSVYVGDNGFHHADNGMELIRNVN